MPHIPIPPTMTTQQTIQILQGINNMTPQNNVVQQITDLAREQAKIALEELMKLEQEKRKQTFLTIENIDKIKGHKYSEWLEVGGVRESDTYYEFTLLDEKHSQVETILLHRRQTSDKRYIMEYNNQTLWITKDRLSTIEGIIECMREI
jgi:DMSO/TMAO reductase YedYZ molybdopterin-dependent catalytic subunit